MEDKLATKQDIRELQTSTQHDIRELREELRTSLERTELKLTVRMGTMLAASIAILTTIQKLF